MSEEQRDYEDKAYGTQWKVDRYQIGSWQVTLKVQ